MSMSPLFFIVQKRPCSLFQNAANAALAAQASKSQGFPYYYLNRKLTAIMSIARRLRCTIYAPMIEASHNPVSYHFSILGNIGMQMVATTYDMIPLTIQLPSIPT